MAKKGSKSKSKSAEPKVEPKVKPEAEGKVWNGWRWEKRAKADKSEPEAAKAES